MPEMPGEEVFKRIRRLNPEARIILASGYSLEESAREILDEPMVEFLHKPYQLQELAQKLEALLRE
jgi:CheY-like chemotaxis protein